jgi:tetratricopeptide (TPR) repeat protein
LSEDFERRLAIAQALGRTRRLRECALACKALCVESPADVRAWRLLAWARFEAGSLDGAIEAASRALALDATDVDSLRVLGRARARTGALDAAIEALSRVATLARSRPDDDGEDEARLARVCTLSEAHRDETAKRVREAVISPHTSARALHQWLRAAGSLALEAHSERFARALLERAPDDPYFRASVASAMARLGRHDEARAHATAAIAMAPNNVLAWTVRALACARLGLDEEHRECEQALRSARRAKREPHA